ncbi:hypothetical protein [Nonomuraea typhae]|uniref:hypothetical protein n=1 Tax=Nonomuraea typhae TaxID=2603600 RepID=UPI0012F93F6D|nr:hypothetical protein [Nonomuraea typhae]
MTSSRRRITITIAALALAGFATACGAVDKAVNCNAAAQEVTKISNEFTQAMTSAATDPGALSKAADEAAGKVKTLAGKHDGELAAALNDLASGFEGMKDPSSAMAGANKIQGFITKIQSACS